MGKKKSPRNHGLAKPPPVKGAPKVAGKAEGSPPCPNCGCETLFFIEVELDPTSDSEMTRLLKKPEGPYRIVGNYIGCPACPWASPMMASANPLPS